MSTEYFCQRQQIVRSITLTPFGCSGNYLGSPSSSSSHEMSVKQSVSWLFMASSSTAQPSLLSRPERPRNEDSFTTCPYKLVLAMPVFVLDRKVSTSVPLGNSHSFVWFLLPPQDIGPAQLSTTSPPPWSPQGELSCVCVFLREIPVRRKMPPEEDLFSVNL